MSNSDDIAKKLGASRAEPAATSGDRFDYEKALSRIKGMLVGDQHEYAEHTLRGIMTTIERTHVVTPGQLEAIDNIEAKPSRRGGSEHSYPRRDMRNRRERE